MSVSALAGVVFIYTVLQKVVWWFVHVAVTFWGILFPFHYQTYKTSGKIRHVHRIAIAVGLLLPLIPVIAAFGTGGYAINTPPTLTCVPSDRDAIFYGIILLPAVMGLAGLTFQILIFWKLFKVHNIKT